MKYWLAAVMPAVMVAALVGHTHAVARTTFGASYLIAAPQEGHAGDPIYLSGSGLPSKKQEWITMICPGTGVSSTPVQTGQASVSFFPGPKTNASGDFVAFKFAAPSTNFKSQVACTIYASVGDNFYGPDIKGTFLMRPSDQSLDPCARSICGIRVHTAPTRARQGLNEHISIQDPSWPGATAAVTIQSGTGALLHRRVRLNIHGQATYLWPVKLPVDNTRGAVHIQVTVDMHLGRLSGRGKGQFTVER